MQLLFHIVPLNESFFFTFSTERFIYILCISNHVTIFFYIFEKQKCAFNKKNKYNLSNNVIWC